MTVEKKKSQVNTRTRYSKYEFSLLCRFISLDTSAEHLVIHQGNTVRLMNSRDISGDCGTSFQVSNYSTKASIAPKHPQYFAKKILPLLLPELCRNAENVCGFSHLRSTHQISDSFPYISYGTRCENVVIETHNHLLLS